MRTDRLGQLCFLSFAILGACSRSAPSPALLGKGTAAPVIATFEGSFDPVTRAFSVRAVPVVSASGEALVAFPPWQDGTPSSGPDNTLELVTEPSPAPGVVSNGCGGGVDSFEGAITVRSFYLHQTFSNLYIELTNVAPTGFEGCNSDPAVTGVGNSFGLWSYGTIGPKGSVTPSDHATRTWKFRFATSQAFTFQGRIMANLGAPVAQGGDPEFDWWPGAIVTPPHSFQDVPTTRAHLVWNGSTFVDTRGLITFVPQGLTPPSTTIGLWDPAQPMVGPFGSTSFFIADAAHGGNAIDTSGDFTVCVKFKPGVQPGFVPPNPNKILVAKGFAEAADPTDGWALMQMHDEYCFHYRTAADLGRNDVMSYTDPQTSHPEAYTFDYICGGRVGNVIHSGAHGRSIGIDGSETGTFANPGSLPLAIGAYPDGTNPATDVRIYEVIFDSRPATLDVMNDIVSDAEGRKLPGSAGGSATYLAPWADGTTVIGADGGTYVLPAYATHPLPTDGSGLLAEGTVVEYSHPVTLNTSVAGFCAGAEIVANGAWSNVSGGFLHFPGAGIDVVANPFFFGSGFGIALDDTTELGWAAGSAHTLKVCVAPGGNLTLYPDGVPTASVPAGSPVANLADPGVTNTIQIGTGGGGPTPLSGARIRRVFVCPGSNPALCN